MISIIATQTKRKGWGKRERESTKKLVKQGKPWAYWGSYCGHNTENECYHFTHIQNFKPGNSGISGSIVCSSMIVVVAVVAKWEVWDNPSLYCISQRKGGGKRGLALYANVVTIDTYLHWRIFFLEFSHNVLPFLPPPPPPLINIACYLHSVVCPASFSVWTREYWLTKYRHWTHVWLHGTYLFVMLMTTNYS